MIRSKLEINGRPIGKGHPTYIIAEIGSNHNGKLEIAKQIIDLMVEAGADAVKFQSFTVENWLSKDFTVPSMKGDVDDWEKYLQNYELSYKMYAEIVSHCEKQNITCFSTPSHKIDIDKLNEMNVPAFKFGSVQITDLPTIEYAAKLMKPIILSAGASDMSEVLKAVEVVLDTGNNQLALLHCTTKYPCDEYELVNLNVLNSFKAMFDFPIGYSDHTPDPIIIPVAAVSIGAKIIEKHVTLDRNMEGPDHSVALEPEEFSRMVKSIKSTEKAFGSSYRRILPDEKEFVEVGRRSLVTTRKIKKGEVISEQDITIKRPGTGIAPCFIHIVVGRVAKKDIDADHVLNWDMV